LRARLCAQAHAGDATHRRSIGSGCRGGSLTPCALPPSACNGACPCGREGTGVGSNCDGTSRDPAQPGPAMVVCRWRPKRQEMLFADAGPASRQTQGTCPRCRLKRRRRGPERRLAKQIAGNFALFCPHQHFQVGALAVANELRGQMGCCEVPLSLT